MTQHLSTHDVRGIAEYVRIALSDDEIEAMTTDLNSIIDGFEPLLRYDLEGVEPTFHPIGGLANVVREDKEEPSFTQAQSLANAASTTDGCFLIPSILGEGGDQ